MDKQEENINEKEGEIVGAVAKEQGYKKLSLSPKKLEEVTVRPIAVKDGKVLFDKTNKDHRYIVEGEN